MNPNMKPYFYRGRYSPALLTHVLANATAFDKTMRASVEAFGGKLVRCHLSAAGSDPIGFLDFPSDIAARSWNAFYASQKGVLESHIQRLLDDADLADMAKLIASSKKAATGHRSRVTKAGKKS